MVVDHDRQPREDDDEDGLDCARGIMFATPISLVLWLLIFLFARHVVHLI